LSTQAETNSDLGSGRCLYAHTDGLIASVCAPPGGNGTSVTSTDIKSTFDTIISECADSNNGVHTSAEGATYSVYSLQSARKVSIPDLNRRIAKARRSPETTNLYHEKRQLPTEVEQYCDNFAYDGTSFSKDNGDACKWPECKDPADDAVEADCVTYCEKRITGYLGPEVEPGGPYGQPQPPGAGTDLEIGLETTVTVGVSAGLEASWLDAIAAGAQFSYSVGETKAFVQAHQMEVSDVYWNRWVYFPLFIETCGDIAIRKKEATGACTGKDCLGGGPKVRCAGDTEIKQNICSISEVLFDGYAVVQWVTRWEEDKGKKIVDWDKQSLGYKGVCSKAGAGTEAGDPDGDEQKECFT
jgi:hypothetical protein